jgi:hypothetical protein
MTAYDPQHADPHAGRERWQRRYAQAQAAGGLRDADFTTLSGDDVEPVYGPGDGETVPGFERIGWPGEYPFTRGVTGGAPGRFASSPDSATPGRPTSVTSRSCAMVGAGSQWPSTCRP